MRMTEDIFKYNLLQLRSICPTLLAKRHCDPYIWDAMAFSQMKRNCYPTRHVFVARLAETTAPHLI